MAFIMCIYINVLYLILIEKASSMHSNKPQVYVVVPVTIPGMNKAVFYETFQKIVEAKGLGYSNICLKQIKKEFAEKIANNKRNNRFSVQDTKDFINRKAKQLFREKFEDLLRAAGRTHLKAQFVCIEKNHPPNALSSVFRLIQGSSQGLNVKVIALVPSGYDFGITYELDGIKCYHPISANLFFTCFDHIQKRQDHETLNGEGSKSAEASLNFLCLFKDFSLDQGSLTKGGFDKVFYVPFAEEQNPPEIPKKLTEALITAVKSYDPNSETFKQSYLENLNTVYEEFQVPFKSPELGAVETAITRFLEAEIYPEVFSEETNIPEPVSMSSKEAKKSSVEEKVVQVEERKQEKKSEEPATKSVEIKYEYKRQRAPPAFLGIFPIKGIDGTLKEFTLSGLKTLTEHFQSDEPLKSTVQGINKGTAKLKFVEEPHVMAYYIGEDKDRAKADYFKSFINDQKVDLELSVLIVVPDQMVIALCNPDYTTVKVYEGYPSMVLMKGDWSLKISSVILDKIFAKDQPLYGLYQSKKIFTQPKLVEKILIELPGGPETAYIVKPDTHLIVAAETGSRNRMPS